MTDWAKEEEKETKGYDTIIYLVFLAFMWILVFLFTGIITFLSSVIPSKIINYLLVILGSLIIGGLVYSLITRITSSEVRVLFAGILAPFTGVLNLLLVSHVVKDVSVSVKESMSSALLLLWS